jgi:hypothetical protein
MFLAEYRFLWPEAAFEFLCMIYNDILTASRALLLANVSLAAARAITNHMS